MKQNDFVTISQIWIFSCRTQEFNPKCNENVLFQIRSWEQRWGTELLDINLRIKMIFLVISLSTHNSHVGFNFITKLAKHALFVNFTIDDLFSNSKIGCWHVHSLKMAEFISFSFHIRAFFHYSLSIFKSIQLESIRLNTDESIRQLIVNSEHAENWGPSLADPETEFAACSAILSRNTFNMKANDGAWAAPFFMNNSRLRESIFLPMWEFNAW